MASRNITVLPEIFSLDDDDIVHVSQGSIDSQISFLKLKQALASSSINWAEAKGTYTNVSGTVQLDCQGGLITTFEVTPNGNISDLSIINTPADFGTAYGISVKLITDGSSQVIFNPTQFNWSGGTQPAFSLVAGSRDWIVGFTMNNGTNYDTFHSGVVGP